MLKVDKHIYNTGNFHLKRKDDDLNVNKHTGLGVYKLQAMYQRFNGIWKKNEKLSNILLNIQIRSKYCT